MSNLLKKLRILAPVWDQTLPAAASSLIQAAGGSEDYGNGRRARAEIEVRSSLALTRATNVLAFSTSALCIATVILVLVTALK